MLAVSEGSAVSCHRAVNVPFSDHRPSMTDSFEILRRHFVAIATATYEDPAWHDLPGVHDEVAVLRDWLCSDHLTERRFGWRWPELATDPSEDQIRVRLKGLAPNREWTDADAAVLYVTGHGVESDSSHFLILSTSELGMVASTALRTSDLIAWLADTPIEHLMIIIDACFAGQIAQEVLRLQRQFHRRWLILPSVMWNEFAVTGALTTAIGKFLDALKSAEGRRYGEGPYLDVASFIQDVQNHLGPGQSLHPLYGGQLSGPHVCLPNPHYQVNPALPVGPARREMALLRQELETHWSPRSRGVTGDADPGWLFSGRKALMRKLIAAARGRPRVTVVSGGAGSGKSAVLARLVTLSDHQFVGDYAVEVAAVADDLKPAVGSIDVAVVATGKLHTQILKQICTALQVPTPDATTEPTVDKRLAQLHSWLNARTDPVTIVIDGLDEAADPDVLVREVLAFLEPDTTAPKVRLLIGVRSIGTPRSGMTRMALPPDEMPLADLVESILDAERISADETPWWNQTDVVTYVESILRHTPDSPYASVDDESTKDIANAVGSRAGRSFLVARIAASSLAARDTVVAADDPFWLQALDDGLLGVFRDDLHHTVTTPAARRRAVMLMRAVAFAFGSGLPWRGLWPLMATAVDEDGLQYGDSDILALLNSRLGAYLVTDRDDSTTVYRLFHDSLRDTLRDRWREVLRTPTAAPPSP
jgi:hypothetical protein